MTVPVRGLCAESAANLSLWEMPKSDHARKETRVVKYTVRLNAQVTPNAIRRSNPMPNDRKRSTATCSVCLKLFTLPKVDYEKKLKTNIGGRMYCSRACYNESLRVKA